MKIDDLIQKTLADVKYKENPYFIELLNGNFSRDDFLETQIQFFFAVIFFNRPMSALAAKIPSAPLRVEILRNVWEEHGEGDINMMHENTFLTFLHRLGAVTKKDIAGKSLWPEIRIFNTCLTGACVIDDYIVGTAVMGIIERMFCDISSIIGRAVIERGWITEEELIHYNLHEELDIKHSQDFFDVLSLVWNKDEMSRYHVEQGFMLGATLFNNLYAGLYYNRSRRMKRVYFGPHSRAEGIL